MSNSIENQIKELIASEIKGNFSITNLHGVDLKKCLVEPFRQIFEKSFREGEFVELFVILKEHPQTSEGYLVELPRQYRTPNLSLKISGIHLETASLAPYEERSRCNL